MAHERRAGQSSVCKVCVKPHQIPADRALWLDEFGALLYPPVAFEPPPALTEPAGEGSTPEPLAPDLPASTEPMANHDGLSPTIPDLDLLLPDSPTPLALESDPGLLAAAPPEVTEPEPIWVASVPRASRSTPPAAPAEPEEEVHSDPVFSATLTPPPAAAPPPPERPRPRPVAPARSEPVRLQTQADIAVALTAALTSRMKPPANPRRDLRPSTAVWMLLTGLGVALVCVALFSDTGYRWGALTVGAAQIVAGYAWIVWLTHQRDPQRGVLCAIPPITFLYLFQHKYAKLRPLRFVGTGMALAALAALVPVLAPHTQELFRRSEADAAAPPTDLSSLSKLAQLRHYREQRSYEPLCQLLDVLAKTDPLLSEDKKDRVELSAELRELCEHLDTGVKIRAMSAYARWDPDGARAVCLAAVRSESSDERRRALELLPHWRDSAAARAAQSLIGRSGVETNQAKAALEEIGGAPAEEAAWALLNRVDDTSTKLTALSVLEKVGGASTVADLRNYATASEDEPARRRALAAANAIEARLRTPAPAP
jgi:hypothetical protein